MITVNATKRQAILENERKAWGIKCQAFGADLIAYIHAINDTKALTPAQFQAIMADQTLANIERLLWNGSLVTAKMLIASQAVQAFFTAEEIAVVTAKIDVFLQANGKT